VFSSGRSGLTTLWRVPSSGGEIEALAGVGEDASLPAVSPRGNLLAYTRYEANVNIWSIRVTPSGRLEGLPRKLISGSRQQMDDEFSPDGKQIVFFSDRSGSQEIWVANADGSNAAQLTSFAGPITGTPRWSPDGRWIVFDSRPSGHAGVFVVSAEGGAPRLLTPPTMDAFVPSWSSDGKWIYFCWNRSGDLEIWRMPVEGGAETLVLNKAADRLWTLTDHYLYFMDVEAKPHATINRLDLATEKITRMAEVEKDLSSVNTGLSVSPGGERIIYPQVDEQNSRIMLVENFR
jgi:Tol biopolymer transport system component